MTTAAPAVDVASAMAAATGAGDQWEQAACRPYPSSVFFPGEPGYQPQPPRKGQPDPYAAAKAICARCPLRTACRRDALERGEPWGVWGGLDPWQRQALRGRHARQADGDAGDGEAA